MNRGHLLLDRVCGSLANADIEHEREPMRVTAHMSSMRCVIEATDFDYQATDGARIVGAVDIYNLCERPSPHMRQLEYIGKWNAYTSMLSAIHDGRGIGVAARIILYDDPQEVVEQLYAPLVYCASWLSFGLSDFLSEGYPSAADFLRLGVTADMSPSRFGIPLDAAKAPVQVRLEDLQAIEQHATARRMLSFADEKGVNVEFPWDRDAMGAAIDVASGTEWKRTALFRIQTEERHPLFGNGLLARLQLPISIENEQLASAVNSLNRWELQTLDVPPFFGSWCMDPEFPSPAFVCFVPAMFSQLVNARTLYSWAFMRHRAVMAYLKQRGND